MAEAALAEAAWELTEESLVTACKIALVMIANVRSQLLATDVVVTGHASGLHLEAKWRVAPRAERRFSLGRGAVRNAGRVLVGVAMMVRGAASGFNGCARRGSFCHHGALPSSPSLDVD